MIEPVTASLSALASILSIASSVRELANRENISPLSALKRYAAKLSGKDRELLKRPETEKSVLALMCISAALLKQLEGEARECERKHIDARKKAQASGKIVERGMADRTAADCMCSVLRSMMMHNKGELPKSQEIESWWDSYGCLP